MATHIQTVPYPYSNTHSHHKALRDVPKSVRNRQGDERDMLSHRCHRCHHCRCCHHHCHCSCVTSLLSLLLLLPHSSCPLVHIGVLDQGRVQGGHLASPGMPQLLVSTYNEEWLRTHLGGPSMAICMHARVLDRGRAHRQVI